MTVCVIGEALVDLVYQSSDPDGTDRYLAHPGGSPFNVAIGLARLGRHSRLLARLSGDAFGRQLRAQASANGVDLSLAVPAVESSTLAVVSLDAERNANYDFYRTGTADWQWNAAELARIPADADWLHAGSLASWIDPGALAIEQRLAMLTPTTVLSYDPNIRPALLGDRGQAVARIERLVALSRVVKASAEDLAWLYPDRGADSTLRHWQRLGPAVVVVTDGSRGARAIGADAAVIEVPGRSARVVDTVGAGDAFMAGLIDALITSGLLADGGRPSSEQLRPAVEQAVLVAALTVARAGADPPTAAELMAEGAKATASEHRRSDSDEERSERGAEQ
ncbi:MAG: carbohydrate kinase family protein [Jatrophihabitantaceae bacterium]